jgi:hypothetical protein
MPPRVAVVVPYSLAASSVTYQVLTQTDFASEVESLEGVRIPPLEIMSGRGLSLLPHRSSQMRNDH